MKSIIEGHVGRLLALTRADLRPRWMEASKAIEAEDEDYVRQQLVRDREEIEEWEDTVNTVLEYLASLEIRNHELCVKILAESNLPPASASLRSNSPEAK